MKRTIKFRAWNTEMNHMVFPSLEFSREIWPCFYKRITNTNEKGEELVMEMVSVDHILQSPEFIVSQFTGLLDKNGKEIYEGDILLLPYNFKGVVKYKEGSFIIENTNNKFYYLGELISNLSYEIIGNIHETPEIL